MADISSTYLLHLDSIWKYSQSIWDEFSGMGLAAGQALGQAVATLLIVIYVFKEILPMIKGDMTLDVTRFIKPVIIFVTIAMWGEFCKGLFTPFKAGANKIETVATSKWDNTAKKLYKSTIEYNEKLSEVNMTALALAAEDHEKGKSIIDLIISPIKTVMSLLGYLFQMIITAIQTALMAFLVSIIWVIAMLLMNISCATIMMGAVISLCVMAFLGPLTFGLSIYDDFSEMWIKWLTNFFSIALYPIICCVILVLLSYAIDASVDSAMADVNNFVKNAKILEANPTAEMWAKLKPQMQAILSNPIKIIVMQVILGFASIQLLATTPTLAAAIIPDTTAVKTAGIIDNMSNALAKANSMMPHRHKKIIDEKKYSKLIREDIKTKLQTESGQAKTLEETFTAKVKHNFITREMEVVGVEMNQSMYIFDKVKVILKDTEGNEIRKDFNDLDEKTQIRIYEALYGQDLLNEEKPYMKVRTGWFMTDVDYQNYYRDNRTEDFNTSTTYENQNNNNNDDKL